MTSHHGNIGKNVLEKNVLVSSGRSGGFEQAEGYEGRKRDRFSNRPARSSSEIGIGAISREGR